MFLILRIIALMPRKRKNSKFWGKWGQKNGLVGDLLVKFSKIVLKFSYIAKSSSHAIAGNLKFCKKNFSHCPSAQLKFVHCVGAYNWFGQTKFGGARSRDQNVTGRK